MKIGKSQQDDGLDPQLPLTLQALPFDPAKLGSAISARTLQFHHGQHHKAYIDKVNVLTEISSGLQATTLEQLLAEVSGKASHTALHNNALQCWNHQFQWLSLSEGTNISNCPLINELVESNFDSIDNLVAEAETLAKAHFGSGWLWLIADGDLIKLVTTHDAERAAPHDSALLVLDLWEHAYYLDHQNRKDDYIDSVIRHHWNWAFAEKRLERLK
jgi:superoxide dismutase, Fe-Mn family